MKLFFQFLVIFSLSTACSHEGEKETKLLKQSLNLVFEDTFDEESLDTLKWNFNSANPAPFDKILPRGNCDFENAAILQKENINIENGFLNLIAKNEKQSYSGVVKGDEGQDIGCKFKGGEVFKFNQNFTSASIFANKGYDHGFFECRAKIPCALGLYPVFWLWHHDEIVVFEFFGASKNHFVSAHNKEKYVTKKFSQTEYCKNFHSYAVYWTNENITWYFDDKPIWRILRNGSASLNKYALKAKPDSDKYNISESFPDSTNRWLNPNISLRIYEWADEIDFSNFPDTLKIDYVRIYQNKTIKE